MKLLRRLSILLAALAVLVMSTAYAAHRHKQDLASESPAGDHCELCLQVARAAGPLAVDPTTVVTTPGWTLWLVLAAGLAVLPRTRRHGTEARAPPR